MTAEMNGVCFVYCYDVLFYTTITNYTHKFFMNNCRDNAHIVLPTQHFFFCVLLLFLLLFLFMFSYTN